MVQGVKQEQGHIIAAALLRVAIQPLRQMFGDGQGALFVQQGGETAGKAQKLLRAGEGVGEAIGGEQQALLFLPIPDGALPEMFGRLGAEGVGFAAEQGWIGGQRFTRGAVGGDAQQFAIADLPGKDQLLLAPRRPAPPDSLHPFENRRGCGPSPAAIVPG